MDSTRSFRSVATADAWQPLTFGGVAAFAAAPFGRLFLVASLVGLLVTASVFRLAWTVWDPTASAAIGRLPAEGRIDDGQLVWPIREALALADNAFVSISVTPAGVPAVSQSADVQFEFRSGSLAVSSLLGSVDFAYPRGYVFALNRTELEPLWGAWRPHLLAGVAITTFLSLLLLWSMLATILAVPLRVYALIVERRATLHGCWKLAVAALLPGALIMSAAVLGYGFRRVSLGELLLINGLHLLVGAGFILISPLRLPPTAAPSPFAPGESRRLAQPNPFAPREPDDDDSDGQIAEPPESVQAGPPSGTDDRTHEPPDAPPPVRRHPREPDEPLNPS